MLKLSEIREKFNSEEACLIYLSELKWSNGYKCPKCGCTQYYKGRKYYFRKCQNCDFDESPTAGTLFHKLKFSMVTAFEIIYWITQTKKGMSTVEIANHFGINQKSAWRFKRKVQVAMSEAKHDKLSGNIEIDEFMLGSPEKKAQGRSLGKKHKALVGIETMITRDGNKGIRKAFCKAIKGYSSKDFRPFFEECIHPDSKVKSDKWTGYKPLKKDYKIKMVYSKTGKNFKELHLFIMNLKGWMRGIHHSVSHNHFQAYLDEFCYRFNNRFEKKSIFQKLIENMIEHKPVFTKNIYNGI